MRNVRSVKTAVQAAWVLVALGAFALSASVLKGASGYVCVGLFVLIWVTWAAYH
jgi:hypothetical protein